MNNVDRFEAFYPKEDVTVNEMPSSSKEKEKKTDRFAKYYPKEYSWGDTFSQHITQGGTRIAQELVSAPGDFMRFLADYGTTAAEKISGKDLSGFRQGLENTAAFKLLPSSETAAAAISKATGGKSEPKTEAQKTQGDVIGLFSALSPFKKDPTKLVTMAKTLFQSLGVKGFGEMAKGLGFGETGQGLAELGALGVSGMIRPKAVQEYLGKRYDALRRNPISAHLVPPKELKSSLDKVKSGWKYGGDDPSIIAATPKLKDLEKLAKKPLISIDELLEARKKIGKILRDKKLYEGADTTGRKDIRARFEELKSSIDNQIKLATPKKFYSEAKEIDAAYSAFAKSKQVEDWIVRNKNFLATSVAGGTLLEMYALGGNLAPAAAIATGAAALNQAGQVAYRFAKNPTLRKFYGELTTNILREDGPAIVKSLDKLNKALEKEKSAE